jgi:hypothetical protein
MGDDDYAVCLMREDGFCSLLTNERLCAWQKLRGRTVGAVCDDYPRTYVSYLGDEYAFPTVSCEAIVEPLVKRLDPLRLESRETNSASRRYRVDVKRDNLHRRPLLEYYPELMHLGLALLQDRRFTLDRRFVLLANAMSQADWLERHSRTSELPVVMERFLEDGNLRRVLDYYGTYEIGPQALLSVCGSTLVRFVNHPAYKESARLVLNGLGIKFIETTKDADSQLVLKTIDTHRYRERKRTLSDFMHQKQVFLEHIMVLEFLRSMTPITDPGIWESFMVFNACYALNKGIVYGSFFDAPDDAPLVDAIVLVNRLFSHNYSAYRRTLDYLQGSRHADMLSMIALANG